jgi:hypothetical protein
MFVAAVEVVWNDSGGRYVLWYQLHSMLELHLLFLLMLLSLSLF